MTEIMFETFRVPCIHYFPLSLYAFLFYSLFLSLALYSQAKEVLALYTSGRTTGVVVDCGESATTAVPIYEGYKISSSIKTLDIAGRRLTEFLARLVSDKDISSAGSTSQQPHPGSLETPPFKQLADREAIRVAKEQHCFVAIDFEQQITSNATPAGANVCSGHLLRISIVLLLLSVDSYHWCM